MRRNPQDLSWHKYVEIRDRLNLAPRLKPEQATHTWRSADESHFNTGRHQTLRRHKGRLTPMSFIATLKSPKRTTTRKRPEQTE